MKSGRVLLCFAILPVIWAARRDPFYRKDYAYIKEYDAFYKIHGDISGTTWNGAFLTCDDEGATLFYPKSEDEWKIVASLRNTLEEPLQNITEIFVGIHDEYGVGEFMTVDGHSTPSPIFKNDVHDSDDCVKLDILNGDYHITNCTRALDTPLPFVCKKVEDISCPTIDRGYKYDKDLKKCYKVNRRPKMWQEAMKTCFLEGGILTVASSQDARNILRDEPNNQQYFVGVRRMYSNGDYYTVKGEQFSKDINPYGGETLDCVTMLYQQGPACFYNTAECGKRLPFICEMDVENANVGLKIK